MELDRYGSSYETIEYSHLGDSLSKIHDFLIHTPPLRGVMVFGGDGTVHQAANAILKTNPSTPLGVVPSGTGNDFAKQCGLIGLSPRELLNLFMRKKPEVVDLLDINGKYCLQVLSTGFDALVSARSSKWPSILGNSRYVLGLLVELLRLKPIDYRLNINGNIREIEALMISCANGRYYGGGMMISPTSNHQDGLFEIVIIHPVSRFELLKVFPKIFDGSHIDHPAVEMIQVNEVDITALTIAQGDGEPIADQGTPLKIRCDHFLSWKL